MKRLLLGIVVIVVVGVGGFVYRNAVEHPNRPGVCPIDRLTCPDGTAIARAGDACEFPACPPPNVSLGDLGIAFAVPAGFVATALPDLASVAMYEGATASTSAATIVIRRYAIATSSTALATIRETAIGGASGEPVPATSFSSITLGNYRFTLVTLERFEGVVDTVYYLVRGTDVLRFDAIDREVPDWTNPVLDLSRLPANAALRALLSTLRGA